MNDPGLDEQINEHAKTVEQSAVEEEEGEDEYERSYLAPSRWWFASTGFPLVAGTFGPMASAFSICALVENWRVSIPEGGTEGHGVDIPDPRWLLTVNAISLMLALVANLTLLLNMSRKISFSTALPIIIIGWYIASVLLIALVAVASTQLRLPSPPDHALTQAFYYAIIAAVLYFIISSLMVVTVYGALRGHYSREFRLTTSQRSLMLQTIAFMVYLLGGDYAPMTHLGRGLLFPYAIGGIVILGLVIGSIRSLALERGKRKVGARMIEKQRQRVLKKMDTDAGRVKLTPLSNGKAKTSDGKTERERREEEFNLMRKIQEKAEHRRRWTATSISASAWFVLWLVGAVVFWKGERNQGWTYFQSLYFAYVSLLTIGFGDFRPYSNSSKPFFVFWSLLAVPTLTILISNMGDTIIKAIREFTLWIGELTVLPGEGGFKARFKHAARRATNGKVFDEGSFLEKPPGVLSERSENSKKHNTGGAEVDGMAKEYEKEQLDEAEDAREKGDKIGEDIHYYHYLLVKELRNVIKDLDTSPPRKYTYKEWAWFLKLLGEDEGESDFHRAPPVEVNQSEQDGLEVGKGNTQDLGGNTRQWSWLGYRSPLMGHKEEAEWVLERLAVRLEKEMEEKHNNNQQKSKKDVPVSRNSSKSKDDRERGDSSSGNHKPK